MLIAGRSSSLNWLLFGFATLISSSLNWLLFGRSSSLNWLLFGCSDISSVFSFVANPFAIYYGF
jgi:hypothetical protein